MVGCVRVSVVEGPSRHHWLQRSCAVTVRSTSAQEMVTFLLLLRKNAVPCSTSDFNGRILRLVPISNFVNRLIFRELVKVRLGRGNCRTHRY